MRGKSGGSRDDEFCEFVVARRARLFRTAYLLCGDRQRAEDLVQVSLTKVYLAWRRIHRDGDLDAYVRRVLVNAHIDETRRPWRRERPGIDGIDIAAGSGLSYEDSDALWTALRGLSPGQRRVVVLRHYWGLSVEETAADLGVSAGTVKSQTAAALANLREVLAESTTRGTR